MGRPQVVICLSGGLVSDVFMDGHAEITVLDFDTEGADPDDENVVDVEYCGERQPAYISEGGMFDPEQVEKMLNSITQTDP